MIAEKKAKAKSIIIKQGIIDVSKEFRAQNNSNSTATNPLYKKNVE
jgi:hypothetical protein